MMRCMEIDKRSLEMIWIKESKSLLNDDLCRMDDTGIGFRNT